MKNNKKMIISLGILLTGALTFGAISSSAIDPLTSELNRIKTNTEINNKTDTSVLVHVGQREITTTDVLNYREHNSLSQSTTDFTDSDILKHMIKEELFLQLAEKEGVSATLEQGKLEANRMRELLNQQSKEVQDTQKKFIEAYGVTEDEHWENVAPAIYQKLLSKQNLAEKILNEQNSLQKEPSDTASLINQYKEQLFKSAITDGTVKVLDNSIRF
ncbi:hypothetical protein [Paenibacillus lautus]|uniref:hypothetical protein n=1 Tax=Paenibacillus lautus TaxID=1401 RepID=UPI001C7D8465|nr:hypothetical protein [Paenibacillus lautus]MBX4147714.1 hypothetical protein [Paenibacillus lautus]